MPAEGGEEQQVVPRAAVGWASFGVTAKGVYFLTEAGRSSFSTRRPARSARLPFSPVGASLCVSPDDRYVVWAQTDRNTSDLMLVEDFGDCGEVSFSPSAVTHVNIAQNWFEQLKEKVPAGGAKEAGGRSG